LKQLRQWAREENTGVKYKTRKEFFTVIVKGNGGGEREMKKKTTPADIEVTEIDLEEIARLIADGNTSGHLFENGKHIYFETSISCWQT